MSATATAVRPSTSTGSINQGASTTTAELFEQYIKLEPGTEGEACSRQKDEQNRKGSDGSGQGGGLAQFSGTHGLVASPLFASPTSEELGQASTTLSSGIHIKEEVASSRQQQSLQPPPGSGYISTELLKPNSTSTSTTATSPLRTRLGILCSKLRDKAATLKESRAWSPISPSIFLLSATTPTETKMGKAQLPSALASGMSLDQNPGLGQTQNQGLRQGQSQYKQQEPGQKVDGQAGLDTAVLEDPFGTEITGIGVSSELIQPFPYTSDGLPVSVPESWQLPMPTTDNSPWAPAEHLGTQETSHWWDPSLDILDTDSAAPLMSSTSLPYHTLNSHSVAFNNAADSLVPPTTSFDYPLSMSLSLSQSDINTTTTTTTNTDLLLYMPQPRSSISPAQTLLRNDTPRPAPPTTTTTDSRRSSRSRRSSSGGMKHHRHPYHHYNNSVLAAQRAQRSSSSSSSSTSPSPKMSVLAGPPHAHLRGHQQHGRSASATASAQPLPDMGMTMGMGIGMAPASSSSTSLPLGYPPPSTRSTSQRPSQPSSGSPSPLLAHRRVNAIVSEGNTRPASLSFPVPPSSPYHHHHHQYPHPPSRKHSPATTHLHSRSHSRTRSTSSPSPPRKSKHPSNPNPNPQDKSLEKPNNNNKDGFVNYTPYDSALLMTGVAPSGSSKTKARREREAAERQRAFRERLARAVVAAGGDVRRLGVYESQLGGGSGEGVTGGVHIDGMELEMDGEMGYEVDVDGVVDGDVDMDGNRTDNRGPGQVTGNGLGSGIGV